MPVFPSSETSSNRDAHIRHNIPDQVVRALFSGEDWLATSDAGLVTAIEAAAHNTRLAWRSDWAVFRTWAVSRAAELFPNEQDRLRLPVLPEVLAAFIADASAGYPGFEKRKIATVRRYVATVGVLHRLLSLPEPIHAPIVRNRIKAVSRGTGGQRQAAPFHWHQVEMAARVLPDSLKGLRDKALLAVGHNSMARRAELVAIDVKDIDFDGDLALVSLRPTKTSIEAEQTHRLLAPFAAALVRQWLAASGLTDGPLFVSLFRDGSLRSGANHASGRSGRRLSEAQVNLIIKQAAFACALADDELVLPDDEQDAKQVEMKFKQQYSGHSLRVGATQDLAASGVDIASIMQAGGWSDSRMIARYLRKLSAKQGAIAQLFGLSRREL